MTDKERIERMIEAMMELARGNYSVQVEMSGENDDLDALAMGLNMMIDDLASGHAQIQAEIADRQKAERVLSEQRERLKTIFSASPDLLILMDKKFRYLAVNPAFCRFTGKAEEDLIGKTDFEVFQPEQAQAYRQSDTRAIESGKLQVEEKLAADAGGSQRWLQVAKSPIFDSQGKPAGLLVSARDITERKQTIDKEKEYLKDLRFLYNSALDFVEIVPDRDIYRYLGEKIHQLAGSGLVTVVSYKETTGKFTARWITGDDQILDAALKMAGKEALSSEFTIPYESQARLLVGKLRKIPSVLDNIADLKFPIGLEAASMKILGLEDIYTMGLARRESLFGFVLVIMPRGVELTNKDIVETFINQASVFLQRHKVEERLVSSLKEKELLLAEIHHRVKNNLQVISSLLNLQSDYVDDERALKVFADSQNRIETMALIHEKLYESDDLTGINFSEYLPDLVQSLFDSYSVNLDEITLKMDVGDVLLGVDKAIPLALIINELVSNSLQHAFPDGNKGLISIRLHSDRSKTVQLTAADSGIGIPRGIDIDNAKSLGLQLIDMLTEQLHGTLELDRTKGTRFDITFHMLDKVED